MFLKRAKKEPVEASPYYRGTGPRKAPPPLESTGKPPGAVEVKPSDEDDAGRLGDYIKTSRDFLARARQYLAEGDLHQASEKGWGAASHMAQAAAAAQGWTYERHEQFLRVIRLASDRLADRRLHTWRKSANDLHTFYYWRNEALDVQTIGDDLDDVESLMDALQPLAVVA